MKSVTGLAAGIVCWAAAGIAAEPIRLEKPENARHGWHRGGRAVGWDTGFKTNVLRVVLPRGNPHVGGLCPLRVDNEFRPRNAQTAGEWEKLRPRIRRAVRGYFGKMPSADVPLDPRLEQTQVKEEYTRKLITVAFDENLRGRMCVLIPKGTPTPAPAILLYDAFGAGIDRSCGKLYCRAYAIHLAREGFVVVALDHWDKVFGKSVELGTVGAAVHFATRTVDYLLTQKDLVAPEKIGIWGHVYGAEVAQFSAAMDDRIGAVVASCSSFGPTRHYGAAFWSPPFWASGRAGMACINRASPQMYFSRRRVNYRPLPFLTQEMLALIAPRPLLGINPGMGPGVGARASPAMNECIRPVWALYGRPWALELIDHRWKTNEPVNARDYTVDFYLRGMCGINPGKAPAGTVKKILADLRSKDPARQLRGCRVASWWRCRRAGAQAAKLVTSKDKALRRAAAKVLQRIGDVDELWKHADHPDGVVRMTVFEAVQLYGKRHMFLTLARDETDPHNWAAEAKWQTLQVNPWEGQ